MNNKLLITDRKYKIIEYLELAGKSGNVQINYFLVAPHELLKELNISNEVVNSWPYRTFSTIKDTLLLMPKFDHIDINILTTYENIVNISSQSIPFLKQFGKLTIINSSWVSENDHDEFLGLLNILSTEKHAQRNLNNPKIGCSIKSVLSVNESISLVKSSTTVFKPDFKTSNRVITERSMGEISVHEISHATEILVEVAKNVSTFGSRSNSILFEESVISPTLKSRSYKSRNTAIIKLYGRGLVTVGDVIPPEMYRFPNSASKSNVRLNNSDSLYDHVNDYHGITDHYTGSFFYLDSDFPHHFGHLISEQLPRLWAWKEAKKLYPDLKIIIIFRSLNDVYPQMEIDFLNAYGIETEDITWSYTPITVDHLVISMPSYQVSRPSFVNPQLKDIFSTISSDFQSKALISDVPKKIFVSRKSLLGDRRCLNSAELEEWFRLKGFTIIYPEDYNNFDQAKLFSKAEVIVGFGGSAMLNLLHTSENSKVIILSHSAYTAYNEYLLSILNNFDLSYVWSDPDIAHPENTWSAEAYTSSWSFDFKNNTGILESLLA